MNEMSSSGVAPERFLDAADLPEPDQSGPARCPEAPTEEIADFIARRVLEQDAQFFDG
jgi:hypothetical protein